MIIIKILVYGAGVIGSIFAYWLKTGGNDVSVLARGKRLADLRQHGIIIEDGIFNKVYETKINVVEQLDKNDYYDLILVIMQRQQVSQILPILKENISPTIIFTGNNPSGAKEYLNYIERDRILLGFGGPGGYHDDYKIVAACVENAILYIGELDGKPRERVRQIEQVFTDSKIKVDIQEDIKAWLITHASFISPLAMGGYAAKKKGTTLGEDMELLELALRGFRENLKALKDLGIPILPKKFKLFTWMPLGIIKKKLKNMINSEFGRIALSGHANAAQNEMKRLSDDFLDVVKEAKIGMSINAKLYQLAYP